MTTASEDAGVTSTTETDADKAVREAKESLAAAEAVKADEDRAVNPTTPAPDVANGDTSTTSSTTTDAGSQDSGATTEGATDDVPTYPSVTELADAANTLRAATQTKVAAFLDQVSEALIAQGHGQSDAPPAPDPTAS